MCADRHHMRSSLSSELNEFQTEIGTERSSRFTRANSDSSGIPSVNDTKKPKPGPKPSLVTTAIAKLNLQTPKSEPSRVAAGAPPPTSKKPASIQIKKGSSSFSGLTPVASDTSSAVSVTTRLNVNSGANVVERRFNPQLSTDKVTHVKPRPTRAVKELVRLPSGCDQDNNIYEQAVPVDSSKLRRNSDVVYEDVRQCVPTVKNTSEPPVIRLVNDHYEDVELFSSACNQENVYEEAASVCLDRLSETEIGERQNPDYTSTYSEPLYAEAADVVPERLQHKQTNLNRKRMLPEDTYEEIGIVNTDNSDSDDEQELHFKLMVINSNTIQRNNKMWNMKTDSVIARSSLEKKINHLSLMLSSSNQSRLNTNAEKLWPSENGCLTPGGLPEWPQNSNNPPESMMQDILTSCSESDSAKMRKVLVSNILSSQKDHLAILETLTEYMRTFKTVALSTQQQSVIATVDIDTIFYKIPDLRQTYFKNVQGLDLLLKNWVQEQVVAPTLKEFVFEEYSFAVDYVNNYHKAIATVHRCSIENAQFHDLTKAIRCKGNTEKSLSELLLMPIIQFQRNTLLLQDLIRVTPVSHLDYDLLQKSLKLTQQFLSEVNGNQHRDLPQDQRYLVKHGVVVERTGSSRKLRDIFLYNDVIVCTKQKVIRQSIHFEVRWFISLPDLSVDEKFSVHEEKNAAALQQQQIVDLKKKLVEGQVELRSELKKTRAIDGQFHLPSLFQTKAVDKIRKKIFDLESELILSSPYLKFELNNWKTKKQYTLLMQSDYERNTWKELIKGLASKVMSPVKLGSSEVQGLLNQQKMPNESLPEDGDLQIEERLTGNLNITIHKLEGLSASSSTFVSIEIDSFGHFFEKAKTRVLDSAKPQWEEDFDVDLEGSQTLRIMCYKLGAETDCLIGKSALELSQVWLIEEMKEEEITLKEGIVVTISLRYTSAEEMMKRTFKEALFGGRLLKITRQEGRLIPLIVTSCIEELEQRGLKTVGLYRICGRANAVNNLKKDFNRSSTSAAKKLHETDTSVLTSLLKLYFRELPDALFTDELYPGFIKGIDLSDPEGKEKFMASQICSLPEANFATVMYIMDHLVRVAQHEQYNKMSLSSLAVIFGPTLLRPAAKDILRSPMDQLIHQNTETMMQSAILLYFLNLKERNYKFTR